MLAFLWLSNPPNLIFFPGISSQFNLQGHNDLRVPCSNYVLNPGLDSPPLFLSGIRGVTFPASLIFTMNCDSDLTYLPSAQAAVFPSSRFSPMVAIPPRLPPRPRVDPRGCPPFFKERRKRPAVLPTPNPWPLALL